MIDERNVRPINAHPVITLANDLVPSLALPFRRSGRGGVGSCLEKQLRECSAILSYIG